MSPSRPDDGSTTSGGVLTPAQREALRCREQDLFGEGATVTAHASTLRALRRRGLVAGAMPHARVTREGETAIAEEQIDTGERP